MTEYCDWGETDLGIGLLVCQWLEEGKLKVSSGVCILYSGSDRQSSTS